VTLQRNLPEFVMPILKS